MLRRQTMLNRLCYLMEVLLLLSMVMLPVVCSYFLFWPVENTTDNQHPPLLEDFSWTARESLLFIFDNIVIFLVLLQIWFFFKGVRAGQLFTQKRIYNTRYIGLTLVLAYFLSLIFRTLTGMFVLENSDDYMFIVSMELYGLLQLLFGAGLIALSYILEQAKQLKDEHDLVI